MHFFLPIFQILASFGKKKNLQALGRGGKNIIIYEKNYNFSVDFNPAVHLGQPVEFCIGSLTGATLQAVGVGQGNL